MPEDRWLSDKITKFTLCQKLNVSPHEFDQFTRLEQFAYRTINHELIEYRNKKMNKGKTVKT